MQKWYNVHVTIYSSRDTPVLLHLSRQTEENHEQSRLEYLVTKWPTPCSWVFLEPLIVSQLDKRFSRLLRNSKVYYCVQKSQPMDPILSYLNPAHTLTIYLFNLYYPSIYLYVSQAVSSLRFYD
jgi:hypothetical protein